MNKRAYPVFAGYAFETVEKPRRGFPTNFGSLLRAEFVPWKGTNSTLAA